TALGGTEKCCQVPGRSVKRKSIISTFLVLMALRTSSVVEQLRNICCPPVSNTGRASLRGSDAHLQAFLVDVFQLWCGPRISFSAASMCLQISASFFLPSISKAHAFCAASTTA